MRKVPADLDALMWTITESGDLEAIDDFERRFPQFKGELATRMAMVRGLKQSKPTTRESKPIPRFVAREIPSATANRKGVFAVAALGSLAVIALGAYAVIVNLPPPPQDNVKGPAVVQPQISPDDDADRNPGNMDRAPGSTPPSTGTNPPVQMPWDVRQSVAINEASLLDVLKLIGETCSLKIELAPNMPNPTVTVRYLDKTGMEMLKDLGRQYQFTPLEQGEGNVLIVPAVEFTAPK